MSHLPFIPTQKTNGRQAFSLVEVVLAIGVTSFALLGLVALIPVGLNTTHQAADATVQSQIVQFARNEMEMTSFANLSSWNTVTTYFDSQGLIVATATDPTEVYTVTYAISNVCINTSTTSFAPTYPYSTNSATTPSNAALIQVIIANRTMGGTVTTNAIIVPNAGF